MVRALHLAFSAVSLLATPAVAPQSLPTLIGLRKEHCPTDPEAAECLSAKEKIMKYLEKKLAQQIQTCSENGEDSAACGDIKALVIDYFMKDGRFQIENNTIVPIPIEGDNESNATENLTADLVELQTAMEEDLQKWPFNDTNDTNDTNETDEALENVTENNATDETNETNETSETNETNETNVTEMEEKEKDACEADPLSEECKTLTQEVNDEKEKGSEQELDKAKADSEAKNATKKQKCAGSARTSKECGEAVQELAKAAQNELDERAKHGKAVVNVKAQAEKDKCAGDLDNEDAKKACQTAKAETLSETIAAIKAIKEAHKKDRSRDTRVHQKAEAASMEATNEVDAALQQAIARMQAIDEVGAAMQQAIARQREESVKESTLADAASLSKWEEKASFGTLRAASVVQSPIAVVAISGVLGLAVLAAVISRRSRSVPLSLTHALVRGSDDAYPHEQCME